MYKKKIKKKTLNKFQQKKIVNKTNIKIVTLKQYLFKKKNDTKTKLQYTHILDISYFTLQ